MQSNLPQALKVRRNLYLNFILFYLFILTAFFASALLNFIVSIGDWSLQITIWLVLALLGNYLVIFLRKESYWFHFGLRPTRWTMRHFLEGFILPAVLFLPIFLLLSSYGITFGQEVSVLEILRFGYIIFAMAFTEEIVFRGYVFQLFCERRSPIASVFAFSLIFAFAHISNPSLSYLSFLNLFLAGISLSLMYLRTKSLWLGIGFHTGWNFFQFLLLGSPISGTNYFSPVIKTKLNDLPEIIFGGAFGIEGGLFATLLMLFVIFWVAKKYKPIPEIEARKFRELFSPDEYDFSAEWTKNPRQILPIPGMSKQQNINTRE